MKPIRPDIVKEGQPYFDEPVHVTISDAKPLSIEVANMFGRRVRASIEDLSHYKRVPLRWMKPDGKGGLVPRKKRA